MDIKGLGYLISTVSVAFFASLSWPAPGEPQWKAWVVVAGVMTAIGGMAVRYLSHRKDHPAIRTTREPSALGGDVATRPRT